jgi:hypothetical protein
MNDRKLALVTGANKVRSSGTLRHAAALEDAICLVKRSHPRIDQQGPVDLKKVHVGVVVALDDLEAVMGDDDIPADVGHP